MLICFALDSYGGIYEQGSREYTLDDFHSLQLDKMEKYVCLKESGVVIAEGDGESSSSDDDDEDGDSDEDEDDDEGEDEDVRNDEKDMDEYPELEVEEDDIMQETDLEKVSFPALPPISR